MKKFYGDVINFESDELDDYEFLQDVVQYSSSSIDRSSIESIPWADDAIKQNQLDWDRVESMLNGEEPLPDTELRNEILEWQRKFPQFLCKCSPICPMQEPSHSFDNTNTNLDLDSLSKLSLNSNENTDAQYNDEDDGDFPTPKEILERDFYINSVPLILSKRQTRNAVQGTFGSTINHSSTNTSAGSRLMTILQQQHRRSPKPNSPNASHNVGRLRMPPIMNVLESKRRFCGLRNNQSFVQLTQVKQAKSAVVSAAKLPIEPTATVVYGSGRNKSAWHLPLKAAAVSNRFFNNRNAILLPALNFQRMHHTTSTSETATSTVANSDSGTEKMIFQHSMPKVNNFNFMTNTSNSTPSSGLRSISAAVHSRSNLHTLYFPYSGATFKCYK